MCLLLFLCDVMGADRLESVCCLRTAFASVYKTSDLAQFGSIHSRRLLQSIEHQVRDKLEHHEGPPQDRGPLRHDQVGTATRVFWCSCLAILASRK
jgi:hypothetical protein